uniref:Myotrophin n=1 Tax=Romanomermis culicivorax TaxID=13658 RepID=A0A915KAE1_ROMCU
MAAQYGRMQMCLNLLEKGANPSVLNAKKHTPIHLATEKDHPDIVKLFLSMQKDSKALLDYVSIKKGISESRWPNDLEGFTCAHIAAMKGSAAVMKELLKIDKKTVLESKDLEQKTVLHWAVMNGHKTLVKILLNSGADPSTEDEVNIEL